MDLSKLPPWALPVGAGALLGAGVLVTRGKHGASTPAPIPVTGQGSGTVVQDSGSILTAVTKSIGDMLAANLKAQQDSQTAFGKNITDLITAENATNTANQKAITDAILADEQAQQHNLQTFFQNFQSAQSASTDNIAHLIQAQAQAQQQQNQGFFDAIKAWEDQLAAQFAQLVNHPPTPGSTNAGTLIDRLRATFSAAFQRLPGKPAGTPVPNSDITIGDLGAAAPYKQDPGFTYYDTTGFLVTGPFRQFLGNFGGARTYGRPISQVFRDFDGLDTQVFEHAIFKYAPNTDPTHYDIRVIQVV